jgi:hypothetical protein
LARHYAFTALASLVAQPRPAHAKSRRPPVQRSRRPPPCTANKMLLCQLLLRRLLHRLLLLPLFLQQ